MTSPTLSRRGVLQAAAGVAAGTFLTGAAQADSPKLKGRIRHSVVNWCFNSHWKDVDEYCQVVKGLGCESLELIDPMHWPTLKKHGLTCAIAGSHGFVKGLNNPKHQDECAAKIRSRIDEAADFGCPSVITFTGMADDIPADVGADNCVNALKGLAGHAEAKGVTICLEMLNTRASDHPMKGHPGYQGNHTDDCVEILKRVGSPRVKLLFDVYHVQIMDGDVIRRIREHKDFIGHVHTAGNPGRGELDTKQEIYYPPIMQALLDVDYAGFVGHEFIPTRDPLAGLREAIAVCDV